MEKSFDRVTESYVELHEAITAYLEQREIEERLQEKQDALNAERMFRYRMSLRYHDFDSGD